jgi:hypothetical protein
MRRAVRAHAHVRRAHLFRRAEGLCTLKIKGPAMSASLELCDAPRTLNRPCRARTTASRSPTVSRNG